MSFPLRGGTPQSSVCDPGIPPTPTGPVFPVPAEASVLLQLALPGGTRFLGRVSSAGCIEVTQGEAAADRILTCDSFDRRVCAPEPLSARQALQMLDDLEPGVAFQTLRRPDDPRVVYARPRDELPSEVPASPLALALDLLFSREGDDGALVVLEIGPQSAPDLLLMAGRDELGLVDPTTLQIWIHPRDSTPNIAREFAARAALRFDDATPVLRQDDLLRSVSKLGHFPLSREFLGRDLTRWTGIAAYALTILLGLSLLTAMGLQYWQGRLASQNATQQARIDALHAQVASLLSDAPLSLAQAASIDLPALLASAHEVWSPGALVQVRAHAGQSSLRVHWHAPRPPPAPGAGTFANGIQAEARTASERFSREVMQGWQRDPPRGFLRSQAQLTGEGDELAILYQAAAAGPGPALRALD